MFGRAIATGIFYFTKIRIKTILASVYTNEVDAELVRSIELAADDPGRGVIENKHHNRALPRFHFSAQPEPGFTRITHRVPQNLLRLSREVDECKPLIGSQIGA